MGGNLGAEFAEAFDMDAPPDIELGEAGLTAGPVVVTLAWNEALRLPHFLDHHRRLGVRRFLVVDNGSEDGAAALLDTAPDVVRLPTTKPYRDFAGVWRRLVADIWLDGRWALFPDVDELFVHPGWPHAPLGAALRWWEAQGAEAVFAPLVDMYPPGPLADLRYAAGAPFLDACPCFDGDGYRMRPRREEDADVSPPVIFRGGPRERLFSPAPRRPRTALDDAILRLFFSPHRAMRRSRLRRRLDDALWRRVGPSVPDASPNLCKIPLVRWRRGLRFSRGPHRLSPAVRVAEEWGTLLHFKFLDDFVARTREVIAHAQHYDGAKEYRRYDAEAERLMHRGAGYRGTRSMTGLDDLAAAGLSRSSAGLDAALAAATGD